MQYRPFDRSLLSVSVLTALAASASAQAENVRFATFNASLNRDLSGQLLSDLVNPLATGLTGAAASRIAQAHNVAEIIQRVNADVMLVNEFDYDQNGVAGSNSTASTLGYSSSAALLFQNNFLATKHGNTVRGMTSTVNYDFRYTPTTNTGLAACRT